MKKVVASIFLAAFMFSLVACGAANNGTDGSNQENANNTKDKVYLAGMEPTFPPFEFADEKTGDLTGFDVELIKAIAQEAGFKVEVKALGFDGLIPSLKSGNLDIAISGMTINKERLEEVDFSAPYFQSGLTVAVPANNTDITSMDDLKGKIVGVQIGTTGAKKAEELKGQGIIKEVKIYDKVSTIFMELMNGTVDAVINDLPVNEAYISKNEGKVKMVGSVVDGEEYGIAVNKGNAELLKKINDGLEKVKANGKFDELKEKYFGK